MVFTTEGGDRGGFHSDADGEHESALARHRPVSCEQPLAACQMTRTVASTAALLLMGLMGAACDQPATAPSEIAHSGAASGTRRRLHRDVAARVGSRSGRRRRCPVGRLCPAGRHTRPNCRPERHARSSSRDDRVPRVVNGKAVSRAADRADRLPGRAGDGADCREPPNGFTGNRHRALRP